MAHNLYQRNGKVSFASAREKAWHGLGQIVQGAMTSSEAIKAAHLDYEVAKASLFIKDLENQLYDVPNKYATVNCETGEVLGIVGNNYQILQNSEAFEFFDSIVGAELAMFETAGALGKGETIFITAKLPTDLIVGNDDVINNYLLLTNSHDGSKAVEVMFTPIRVVCNNTLQASLRSAKKRFKIKHTENYKHKFEEAQEVLNIVHKSSLALQELFNNLANDLWTDEQMKNMVEKFFPATMIDEKPSSKGVNIQNNVLSYYQQGPGQAEFVGTKYGAYNAVTGYFQNVKNYSNQEDKMKSVMFGNAATVSEQVLDYLILN